MSEKKKRTEKQKARSLAVSFGAKARGSEKKSIHQIDSENRRMDREMEGKNTRFIPSKIIARRIKARKKMAQDKTSTLAKSLRRITKRKKK